MLSRGGCKRGYLLGETSHAHGVKLEFIRPGKPTDNCFIESFNVKFREECLDAHLFTSLAKAKKIIEEWRRDYNALSPHNAFAGMSPEEYRRAAKGKKPETRSPNLSLVYSLG
ncbi:transposase [Desulfolutivibrio sulfodismutans]